MRLVGVTVSRGRLLHSVGEFHVAVAKMSWFVAIGGVGSPGTMITVA